MALIDKIKAQAAVVAQKAQEAGKAGQSKLEDVQARRRSDALLRQLGAAVYAQRSGRAHDDNAAEIDRLVGELSAFESENGPLDAATSSEAAPEAPTETETPPEGGFTL
jgi:hypothetical protein